MADLLGYQVEEILNTPFVNYLAESEKEKIREFYRKRQAGENLPQIMNPCWLKKMVH